MGRFLNWLKSASKQQSAGNKTEGEHGDDSSFSWAEIDQADSSIFDTGSLVIEKPVGGRSAQDQTPEASSSTPGLSDKGVDPYNSGSFDTKNK